MAAGSASSCSRCSWYQRGSRRYARRSADASASRRRNASSRASSASRPADTEPSRRTGSHSASEPAAGSTARKSSRVSVCQDQRRFRARSLRGWRESGRTGRTVNRRMAFTYSTFTGDVRIRAGRTSMCAAPSPSTVAGSPARRTRCVVSRTPLPPRKASQGPYVTGVMADSFSSFGLVGLPGTGKAAGWRPFPRPPYARADDISPDWPTTLRGKASPARVSFIPRPTAIGPPVRIRPVWTAIRVNAHRSGHAHTPPVIHGAARKDASPPSRRACSAFGARCPLCRVPAPAPR